MKKMKCENYECYSTTKKSPIDPLIHFKTRMGHVELIIKTLKGMRPDELDIFIEKLTKNFADAAEGYSINQEVFNWSNIREGLELLPNFPDLERHLFLYICKTLKLPQDYTPDQGEIELVFFDRLKAGEVVSFQCVKTFVDVYGREEGIEVYKQIVPHINRKRNEDNPEELPKDPKTLTLHEHTKRCINSWCNIGLVDFSYCALDDFKVIYRFDRCLVPDVLKEFNDPDLAYLASCYLGDHPSRNEGRVIRMRRTQTLQHSEFCDELYWNNLVHPDTEQPSLEFTKNIGKDLVE